MGDDGQELTNLSFSSDGKTVVYVRGGRHAAISGPAGANAGPDRRDIDRRHLFKTPVNAATPTPLTSGAGIEWSPVVTGDGQRLAP